MLVKEGFPPDSQIEDVFKKNDKIIIRISSNQAKPYITAYGWPIGQESFSVVFDPPVDSKVHREAQPWKIPESEDEFLEFATTMTKIDQEMLYNLLHKLGHRSTPNYVATWLRKKRK